jgi:hypothetical protein
LISSGVMFVQSGIPFKNCVMGLEGTAQQEYLGPCYHCDC